MPILILILCFIKDKTNLRLQSERNTSELGSLWLVSRGFIGFWGKKNFQLGLGLSSNIYNFDNLFFFLLLYVLLLFYKRFFFIFLNFSFSIRDPIRDQIRDLESPILILSTQETVKSAESYIMEAKRLEIVNKIEAKRASNATRERNVSTLLLGVYKRRPKTKKTKTLFLMPAEAQKVKKPSQNVSQRKQMRNQQGLCLNLWKRPSESIKWRLSLKHFARCQQLRNQRGSSFYRFKESLLQNEDPLN